MPTRFDWTHEIPKMAERVANAAVIRMYFKLRVMNLNDGWVRGVGYDTDMDAYKKMIDAKTLFCPFQVSPSLATPMIMVMTLALTVATPSLQRSLLMLRLEASSFSYCLLAYIILPSLKYPWV